MVQAAVGLRVLLGAAVELVVRCVRIFVYVCIGVYMCSVCLDVWWCPLLACLPMFVCVLRTVGYVVIGLCVRVYAMVRMGAHLYRMCLCVFVYVGENSY